LLYLFLKIEKEVNNCAYVYFWFLRLKISGQD